MIELEAAMRFVNGWAMLRGAPLLVAAVLLAELIIPVSVQARVTCAARDSAGHSVGTVSAGFLGKVWDHSGAQVGQFGRTDDTLFVFTQSGRFLGFVKRVSRTCFVVLPRSGAVPQGRAIRWARTWVVQKRAHGQLHTKGTVSGRASGWAAGAALRVLLWK